MKLFFVSLFAVFYCICAIPTPGSSEQSYRSIDDKSNSKPGAGKDALYEIVMFYHQLHDVLAEKSEETSTPSAILDSTQHPEVTDSSSNSHSLNRRSTVNEDATRGNTPKSNSGIFRSEDRPSNQRSSENDTSSETDSSSKSSLGSPLTGRMLNLSNILKNGLLDNVEANVAPQPVRKVLDFVMDRLKSKLNSNADNETQPSKDSFPVSLLERGKSALSNAIENVEAAVPLGIHNALKLGPLSVNFDMGKP